MTDEVETVSLRTSPLKWFGTPVDIPGVYRKRMSLRGVSRNALAILYKVSGERRGNLPVQRIDIWRKTVNWTGKSYLFSIYLVATIYQEIATSLAIATTR